MHEEVICRWLGLSPGEWPPNHYALLGLEPGDSDMDRIEQRVHERLTLLRNYQLSNPEAATTAMNRLAQAFTCLTDPRTKEGYDAALLGGGMEQIEPSPPASEPAATASSTEGDPLAWLFGPWSQLSQTALPLPDEEHADWRTAPPPPVRAPESTTALGEPLTPQADGKPAAAPTGPSPPPIDHRMAAAQSSASARRGLGTKRALYYRIARTRQLIRAWVEIGKFVAQPKRRLTRIAEANDFTAQLKNIIKLLQAFPTILGGAGQPGYFVVILAQQQLPVPTFRALVLSQREQLARDWQDAHTVLLHHQKFLRQELHALRKKNLWGRALRAARAFVNDEPGKFLLLLALIALLLALWLPTVLPRH